MFIYIYIYIRACFLYRDECLKRCAESISRTAVEKLLDKKVDSTHFHEELTKKADLGVVFTQGGELSDTVANHEQVLTILQMRLQELSAYYNTTSATAVAGVGACTGTGTSLDDLFASTLSSFAPAGLHSPGFIPAYTTAAGTSGVPEQGGSNSTSTTPMKTKPWRAATATTIPTGTGGGLSMSMNMGGRNGFTSTRPPPSVTASTAAAQGVTSLCNVTAAVQQGREIGLITGKIMIVCLCTYLGRYRYVLMCLVSTHCMSRRFCCPLRFIVYLIICQMYLSLYLCKPYIYIVRIYYRFSRQVGSLACDSY